MSGGSVRMSIIVASLLVGLGKNGSISMVIPSACASATAALRSLARCFTVVIAPFAAGVILSGFGVPCVK